jgi:Peptidyl-prolyl cis-trans isomerase (rotamase) - cyclophilin family
VSKATKRERQKENRERAREERERLMKRDRRTKAARNLLILLAPIAIIAIIISATSGSSSDTTSFDKNKGYTATIETSEGNIVVALDAKNAPIATKHFVELVDKKFYDGLCIDRLSPDFVIQGGSPRCDQQGGSGTSVSGETPTDHYPIGTLAAAKQSSDPAGTFDSQFFIVTGSKGLTLPDDYASFGTVTSGLDVAQKIEKLAVQPGTEKPVAKITIKRIRITVTAKPAASISPSSGSSSTTATSAPATTSTSAASTSSSTTATSSTTASSSTTTTTTKP